MQYSSVDVFVSDDGVISGVRLCVCVLVVEFVSCRACTCEYWARRPVTAVLPAPGSVCSRPSWVAFVSANSTPPSMTTTTNCLCRLSTSQTAPRLQSSTSKVPYRHTHTHTHTHLHYSHVCTVQDTDAELMAAFPLVLNAFKNTGRLVGELAVKRQFELPPQLVAELGLHCAIWVS